MLAPAALPSTTLEPGDRFEVFLSSDGQTLGLPESFRELDLPVDQLLDPGGKPLQVQVDNFGEKLLLDSPVSLSQESAGAVWLEYGGPGRFQLMVEASHVAEPVESPVDVQARLTLSSDDTLLLHPTPRQQCRVHGHPRRARPGTS